MRRSSFETVLRGIVRVALGSSVGAGAYACGTAAIVAGPDASTAADAAPERGVGEAGFDDDGTFACDAPVRNVLENLTPTVPVDYVALRNQQWTGAGDGGAASPATTAAQNGTVCTTAKDHDACVAALNALQLDDDASRSRGWYTDNDITVGRFAGPERPYEKQFFVYTRGDEVGALRTQEELRGFLGTIDTLEDARLLLVARNQNLVCTTTPFKSGWRRESDGSWVIIIAASGCGSFPTPYRARYRITNDGTVTQVAFQDTGVCGRRPEGLCASPVEGGAARGMAAYFAESAFLEAASVVAFRRLELELRRFGAPEGLVLRARRARADEIDHARETARLARSYGADPVRVNVARMELRSLLSVAMENAVEGCVRETYGALVAAFQSERAAPELRPLLRRIARDEARHAELAHDVARFLEGKLTQAERARVADARTAAFTELQAAVERPAARDVVAVAGMPAPAEARVLLEGLASMLTPDAGRPSSTATGSNRRAS